MNHKGMKNKKSLNHEGREGHEEKRNEALVFIIFLVLTTQPAGSGFHHEV